MRVLGRHGGLAAIEGEVSAGERVLVDNAFNLPDGAHLAAGDGASKDASAGAAPPEGGR